MKKIFAILGLTLASSVFAADSMNIVYANADTEGSGDIQRQIKLGVKHDISKNLSIDGSIIQTQTDNTNALGTRVEVGLTPSTTIGDFKTYFRAAVGEKYGSKGSFGYYAVEPGVLKQVGPVVANLGYRWRTPFDSTTNNDQTHTLRYGVTYPFSKTDSIGLLFDRIRGDVVQNVTALQYNHNF